MPASLFSQHLVTYNARFPIYGQVAQSVEQRTENPRVGGSIPPLATTTAAKRESLCPTD